MSEKVIVIGGKGNFAAGADITSTNESAEFIERMEEGAKFMTTSCCPAYYRAAKVHIPEIQPFVSHTKTSVFVLLYLIIEYINLNMLCQ